VSFKDANAVVWWMHRASDADLSVQLGTGAAFKHEERTVASPEASRLLTAMLVGGRKVTASKARALLDANVLSAIRRWLAPVRDPAVLPEQRFRTTVLELLVSLAPHAQAQPCALDARRAARRPRCKCYLVVYSLHIAR